MSEKYYRHQETYKNIKIDIKSLDKKALEDKVRAKKNEIDAGFVPGSDSMTVSVWMKLWQENYKQGSVSEPYYKSICSRINNNINPEIGMMLLRDIRPIHIQKILKKYEEKSLSFLTQLRACLSESFAQAVNEQYITSSPVTTVKTPKAKSGTHRSLTDEERTLFLTACSKSYAGMWGKMLLYCGLRPQETAPLYWRDIDEAIPRVNISRALKKTGKVGVTKSKSGVRSVPIPNIYYAELKAIRGEPDELVFPTVHIKNTKKGGHMMSAKAMRLRWLSLKREMRIAAGAKCYRNEVVLVDENGNNIDPIAPDLTPYCLRHTYCTDLLRAKVPITTAKYLMGHSDTKMVDRIYGHHTEDQTDTAALLMNTYFNGDLAAAKGTNEGTN